LEVESVPNNDDTEISTIIAFTTAPKSYDGFGSETIEWVPYQNPKGERYRKVAIPTLAYDWQQDRYWSGCHRPRSEQEFEQMVSSDLVRRIT
jgi:hypothetical protein